MNELEISLSDYLEKHFYDIPLESPLFYNAPVGIRFELGTQRGRNNSLSYFDGVLLRSSMIFNEIFDNDEQMIVVVNSYRCQAPYIDICQGDDVFPKYIKDKTLVERVISTELERHREENGDISGITYRHTLVCRPKSINYIDILKAKSYMDFNTESYISDAVFFINPHKHIIFYMYDDRGVDVISEYKDALAPIYQKFNNWILSYDKKQIDAIFNK